MTAALGEADIRRSYRWLGHRPNRTELAAFHPAYRPGRDNAAWNRERGAYPRIAYASRESHVVGFAQRYAGARLVCYSLNPRIGMRVEEHGFPVATKEADILSSHNLLLDFDLEGEPRADRIKELESFVARRVTQYFRDHGFLAPVRAFSGGGCHLLAAYEPIHTSLCPDVRARLREFRDRIERSFRQELSQLETTLDRTQDLRRMLKIYGTAKPDAPVSRFYGGRRQPDKPLREYLLGLDLDQRRASAAALPIGDQLPRRFLDLLEGDAELARLWRGAGQPAHADTTRSGYDYAIVRRLLADGVTDLAEIATVLALRPDGAAGARGKREDYLRRTIANALLPR